MASEFDRNLNIGYVDENIAPPDNKLILKHYLCSFIVYLSIYILLVNNPFFRNYFVNDLRHYYIWAFALYMIISPAIFFWLRPKTIHKSHNIEICNYFLRIFKTIFNKNTIFKQDYASILKNFVPSYNEKQALMLIFIKVFFGTLMVKFFYDDIFSISSNVEITKNIFNNFDSDISWGHFRELITANADFFYRFIVLILFTLDVVFFAFGYITECALFRNKIRTVDTNIAGVLFCLMCYPPFNNATSTIIGWNQSNNAVMFNDSMSVYTWCIRLIALFFLTIYTLASVALGTKASNLTNRGTVSRFPYNIVRHPAYVSKITFWFLTTLPFIIVDLDAIEITIGEHIIKSVLILCSFLFWMLIYYMRAITEERHLMQDPEYQEYAKKVKWRFIPHII